MHYDATREETEERTCVVPSRGCVKRWRSGAVALVGDIVLWVGERKTLFCSAVGGEVRWFC